MPSFMPGQTVGRLIIQRCLHAVDGLAVRLARRVRQALRRRRLHMRPPGERVEALALDGAAQLGAQGGRGLGVGQGDKQYLLTGASVKRSA